MIDSHCHLQFAVYDEDRAEVIERCRQQGVGAICVGTDWETSREAVELAKQHDTIWATVGFHPGHVVPSGFDDPDEGTKAATREPFDAKKFEELAQHSRVVGIGECGLDYFRIRNHESGIKEKQEKVFLEQIELAQRLKKPLAIHCRPSPKSQDAYLEALDILRSVSAMGVIHFFTGAVETAQKILEQGFFIALPGVITFAKEYDDLVRYVPLDRVLVETDAPYAAPVPYRGKRNEPVYVIEVAKKIAEIKNISFDQVVLQSVENTKNLFLSLL